MNTLVCGRMKEGKTTLALYLAREWSNGVVVWDPRHRITGAVYVQDADELEDAIAEKEWQKGIIVFRPDGLEIESQFDEMCSVMFTPVERFDHFALVVDEASEMQSAHRISPRLSQAVKQHPRSVLIVQTTHSLQDWHRASKDLTSDVYSFRLRGRSLQALMEFCDGDRKLEEQVKNLPHHHCIRINLEASDDGEDEITVLDNPSEWFSADTKREEDGINV